MATGFPPHACSRVRFSICHPGGRVTTLLLPKHAVSSVPSRDDASGVSLLGTSSFQCPGDNRGWTEGEAVTASQQQAGLCAAGQGRGRPASLGGSGQSVDRPLSSGRGCFWGLEAGTREVLWLWVRSRVSPSPPRAVPWPCDPLWTQTPGVTWFCSPYRTTPARALTWAGRVLLQTSQDLPQMSLGPEEGDSRALERGGSRDVSLERLRGP